LLLPTFYIETEYIFDITTFLHNNDIQSIMRFEKNAWYASKRPWHPGFEGLPKRYGDDDSSKLDEPLDDIRASRVDNLIIGKGRECSFGNNCAQDWLP